MVSSMRGIDVVPFCFWGLPLCDPAFPVQEEREAARPPREELTASRWRRGLVAGGGGSAARARRRRGSWPAEDAARANRPKKTRGDSGVVSWPKEEAARLIARGEGGSRRGSGTARLRRRRCGEVAHRPDEEREKGTVDHGDR